MVNVFLWIIGVLFTIQVLLLIGLVIGKTRTLTIEKNIDAEVERLAPQYMEYIEGSRLQHPELLKGVKMQGAVIERTLDQLMIRVTTEEHEQKVMELAEQNLSSYYKKALKKGSWAERLNSLYFIEDFQIHSLREPVYQHFTGLRKKDEEYRQSLRVASILQDSRVIDELVKENSFSVAFNKEILFRFNDQLMMELSQSISTKNFSQENLLLAFISINGELKNERFYPFVEKMMLDERKEVRIKAMRSLCKYEKLEDSSKLTTFFKSEIWEERMYAAKLTGACRLNEFKESLVELFSDPVWWVRFAAADNIYELKNGADTLRYIGATSSDAYARDIANHMLTRKGGRTNE